MSKRVLATVPDDTKARLTEWCERLSVAESQLAGMSIQAGLDSIIRAVAPVESVTPDQWAQIVKAMQAQGMVLDAGQTPQGVAGPKVAAKKAAAKKTAKKAARNVTKK